MDFRSEALSCSLKCSQASCDTKTKTKSSASSASSSQHFISRITVPSPPLTLFLMEYKAPQSIPGGDSFLGDKGPTEGLLIAAVLPYVLMIILLPIGSFFITKSFIFQELLSYSDTTANVYAAISSVIILHALLALFIIQAFKEYPVKGRKQD